MPSTQKDPAAPPGALRIGSIAGTGIYVSSSWFLVAALIAFVMAPRVEQVQPGLGAGKYIAGFTFAVVLYLSVLLHEISHALMARRRGYPVTSITLNFLGGLTAVDGEARKARDEFWIAVVGPVTSIAVGILAILLWFVTPDGLLRMGVEGLAGANLLVGVINLVPGLPLDGGRVLKAGVWGATGNPHRGTLAAAWGGRLAAIAVLCWPVGQYLILDLRPTVVDLLLTGVIAVFLWTGASAALAGARLRARLPMLVARDLARRTLTVPGDLPLGEAVRQAQDQRAGGIVTLNAGGQPEGIVNEAALLAVPENRRPWVATSTVARTAGEGLTLPVSISGEELIRAITRRPSSEYLLVEDDGAIFGILATADVDRAFREVSHD